VSLCVSVYVVSLACLQSKFRFVFGIAEVLDFCLFRTLTEKVLCIGLLITITIVVLGYFFVS
jgi:hypothetical protein